MTCSFVRSTGMLLCCQLKHHIRWNHDSDWPAMVLEDPSVRNVLPFVKKSLQGAQLHTSKNGLQVDVHSVWYKDPISDIGGSYSNETDRCRYTSRPNRWCNCNALNPKYFLQVSTQHAVSSLWVNSYLLIYVGECRVAAVPFFGLHCLTSNPCSIRGDELSPPRTRVYRAAWWDGETSQIVGESYQDTVTLSIHVLCPYFKLGEVKYYHLFTTTYQEIKSWMWFDRSHSVVPWCCVPCSYACLGTYALQLNDQICFDWCWTGWIISHRIETNILSWTTSCP